MAGKGKKSKKGTKASEKKSSGTKRKNPILIVKPFIVGNYAVGIKKKESENRNWCKWICYIRGLTLDDDLSYISKVEFHLHETFNPPREVKLKPPFEIEKEGWGEFPLLIDIHFHPSSGLEHVQINYHLKLPPDSAVKKRKPQIFEKYDEFTFYDPNPEFEQILRANSEHVQNNIKKIKQVTEENMPNESDDDSGSENPPKKNKASPAPSTSTDEKKPTSSSSVRLSIAPNIEQSSSVMKEENSLKMVSEMAEKLKEMIKQLEDPSSVTSSGKGSKSRSKTKKSKKITKKQQQESDSDEDDDDYVDH